MDKLNFGEIKKIVLFGGGQGVLDTAKIIKKNHLIEAGEKSTESLESYIASFPF